MIKFFRRIRQNLLSENKFRNYFIYSLGEILLIVLGIMIALSLNNRNENNKLRQNAIGALIEIKNDINTDLVHYDLLISKSERLDKFYGHLRQSNFDSIAVENTFNQVVTNLGPRSFGTSYDKMVRQGLLEFISDKQLQSLLQFYYLNFCKTHNNHAEFHGRFTANNIEGPLLLTLPLNEDGLTTREAVQKEIEDGHLINFINYQNNIWKNNAAMVNESKQYLSKIIELIDLEIEK